MVHIDISVSLDFTPEIAAGIDTSYATQTNSSPDTITGCSCTITVDSVLNDPDPIQNFTLMGSGLNSLYDG